MTSGATTSASGSPLSTRPPRRSRKLGVQRALGLPECATPPEEVYELAKRRGMDFVTITDHDTIDGALAIADRPDVFVSEELTACFRGEPQAGARPLLRDHAGRPRAGCQSHPATSRSSPSTCTSARSRARWRTRSTPSPPRSTPRHRRRLAELFPIWEVAQRLARARAQHAGGDLHRHPRRHRHRRLRRPRRQSTSGARGPRTPRGRDAGGVPRPPARGRVRGARRPGQRRQVGARGDGAGRPRAGPRRAATPPNPAAVLQMVERVVSEGDVRGGRDGRRPRSRGRPRRCCAPGSTSVDLDMNDARAARAAAGGRRSPTPTCYRRARRCARAQAAARGAGGRRAPQAGRRPRRGAAAACSRPACRDPVRAGGRLPRAREGTSWSPRDRRAGPRRRSWPTASAACTASRTRSTRSASAASPGFEVEVIGTDPNVDRRLSAVAEVDIPFYAGLQVGVPSLPAVVEALAEGRYGLMHLCSPGPAGVGRGADSRACMELPSVGQLPHRARRLRGRCASGDPRLEAGHAARAAARSTGAATSCSRRQLGLRRSRLVELGDRRTADRALGPRRRHRRASSPRKRDAGLLGDRRAERALRRAPDGREGRRPARRRVPRGTRARPAACTSCWPAAGPRSSACGSGSATRATFLGWLDGRRARPRVRERRPVPVLPAAPTRSAR